MGEQIEIKPISLVMKEKIFDKIRLYEGKPSVTTVLKVLRDSPEFEKFKEFDMDRYIKMLKAKALQGTMLHECIHDSYLQRKFKSSMSDHGEARMKFYVKEWYKRDPVELEFTMIGEDVWGTCDGVFKIPGREWLQLIDWKTVGQKVYDDLVFKYKMQLSKYATMWNSTHPDKIQCCHIVVFSSKGWYKILTVSDIQKYSDMYDEVYQAFISLWNQYNEIQSGISWVWKSSEEWHWGLSHGHDQVPSTQDALNGIVSGMIWSDGVSDETEEQHSVSPDGW